jgi:ankyrin repeat protein
MPSRDNYGCVSILSMVRRVCRSRLGIVVVAIGCASCGTSPTPLSPVRAQPLAAQPDAARTRERESLDRKLTPLHYAAAAGNVTKVRALVERGDDVNAADIYGFTPLQLSAPRGRWFIDPTKRAAGETTPISDAETTARLLLEAGADARATNQEEGTALHFWASGSEDASVVVKLLVDRGANPSAVATEFRVTPLHFAAGSGHPQVVRTLLTVGANINAKNVANQTPLFLAVSEDRFESAHVLLESGADRSVVDKDGRTAQYYAKSAAVSALFEQDHPVSTSSSRDAGAAGRANSDCLMYEPQVSILHGVIKKKTRPGPPNYDSIADGDRAETHWYLQLQKPICMQAGSDSSGFERELSDVAEIQLVFMDHDRSYDWHRHLLGRFVEAKGTLFGAHTGHHRTPVLLTVASLTSAKPSASPRQ